MKTLLILAVVAIAAALDRAVRGPWVSDRDGPYLVRNNADDDAFERQKKGSRRGT